LFNLRRENIVFIKSKQGLKKVLSPLSKNRGFGVYSMNKTRGRRKMFITRAKAAS
jgi:hypothetical protein